MVDGSPQKLWGSAGMKMKDEYSPKHEMKTEMSNILDDEIKSGKIFSGQSLSVTSQHNTISLLLINFLYLLLQKINITLYVEYFQQQKEKK
jgi:hypothetical protein